MSKAPLLFGTYGSVEPELLAHASDSGANATWFHGFSPEMFAASEKYGLAACVEYKTLRANFSEHPELIPIGIDGKPIRYGRLVQGICLSQSEYLAKIEEDLREGVKEYQPTGVWLDYLTYSGWFETPEPDLQESCFCPACIEVFCHSEGVDADLPEEILTQFGHLWTEHKCRRVASLAHRYSQLIREALPDCVIGAYMCPYLPDEWDGALSRIFAQDYQLMAPAIDVFTPLIYVQKSGRSVSWGRDFMEASLGFVPSGHPVQPILDFLDFPDSLDELTLSQVPAYGVQMFGGRGVLESKDNRTVFRRAVEDIRETL